MTNLGDYQSAVDAVLADLAGNRIVDRLWQHDYTIWQNDPDEIINRLNWLHLPQAMLPRVYEITALVDSVVADGYTHAVLLGMGGSSLAPEVFSKVYTGAKGLALSVLDSTEPGAVQAVLDSHDLTKTLFVVSTKSGGTVETLSFFKFFYNQVLDAVGESAAGQHFVAITDPGSKLQALARTYHFRKTFLNDAQVGGRNSALSFFGLVPAALVGVDLNRLLDRAIRTESACRSADPVSNPAVMLGAVMGAVTKAGRDKMTLVLSPEIASLGDWIEQLVAESTGKNGVGILPVVGEPLVGPDQYGADRLFVALTLGSDTTHAAALRALEAVGHPVFRLQLNDRYDLGEQFLLWEIATAIAGHILAINPFDQPNVESAKVLAREAVAAFKEQGELPTVAAQAPTVEALAAFMAQAQAGDYVMLQAYVTPTDATTTALQQLRLKLREAHQLATCIGYGPRFLHSTGQLHKGDGGNGLFIQFVADAAVELPIPDEAGQPAATLTFGTLVRAQANGDRQALLDAGRRVVRFDLGADVLAGLQALQ
jgi:transaldolase/glucose-6-phosphate isomerase